MAAGSKIELIDEHVSAHQCKLAVDALLKHEVKRQAEQQSSQLLPGKEHHVWLVVTVKKMHPERKLKPHKIPIAYPIVDPRTSAVCLITKDPQREYKDLLEAKQIRFISRVVGVEKLKGKFKGFEERRMLLKENDLFLADERVIPLLPGLLGKKFFAAKKQPIPVCLTRKDLKAELERAVSSTYFHQNQGTCSSVKIGVLSQPSGHVLANLQTALPAVAKAIKGGWDNIQSLHIKTNSSVSLPVWTCDLGAGEGGRWDGLVDVEMDGSDSEVEDGSDGDEEVDDEDEDEGEEVPVKSKGKKRSAAAAEGDEEQPKKKAKSCVDGASTSVKAPHKAGKDGPAHAPPSDTDAAAPVVAVVKPKKRNDGKPAPANGPPSAAADGAGSSSSASSDATAKKRHKKQHGAAAPEQAAAPPQPDVPSANGTTSSASSSAEPQPTPAAAEQPAKKRKRKSQTGVAAVADADDSHGSAPAPAPPPTAALTPRRKQPRASTTDYFSDDEDGGGHDGPGPVAPPPNTPAAPTPAQKRKKSKHVEQTPVSKAIRKLAEHAAASEADDKAASKKDGKKKGKGKAAAVAVASEDADADAGEGKSTPPEPPVAATEETARILSPGASSAEAGGKKKRKDKKAKMQDGEQEDVAATVTPAAAVVEPAPSVSLEDVKAKRSASGTEKKKGKALKAKKSAKDALLGKKGLQT